MKSLSEWDSKQRLGGQLPRPAEIRAKSRAQAEEFTATSGGPFVAKASGIAHKTEGGFVRLGLAASDIGKAWDELSAAGDGSVLIAEQIDAELELIVGGYRDATFGPLVTIGIGGIAAEIFRDMVAMLAPPEEGELADAIGRLAGKQLLQGIRGGPAVDLTELGRIVKAVSDLLCSDPDVVEIDCNPVMVQQGIPIVADALVVLQDT